MRQDDELISSTNWRPTVPIPASFFLFQMSILIHSDRKIWSLTLTIRNLSDCCRACGFYRCRERAWLQMKLTMKPMATQRVEHILTRSGERVFAADNNRTLALLASSASNAYAEEKIGSTNWHSNVYDLRPIGTVTTSYRSRPTFVSRRVCYSMHWAGKGQSREQKNVDPVTVTTFGELELNVRRSLSNNPETECGGQRTANASGGVHGEDRFEEYM